MSIEARELELRKARRMVAIFWVFTVVYLVLSAALMVTRGAAGLIFISILAYSWFFQGLPDTKPHLRLLREERQSRQVEQGAGER